MEAYHSHFSLLLLLALCSCVPAASRPEPSIFAWVFTCDERDPIRVRFVPNAAVLDLGDRTLELPRVVSASGEKYSDGESLLWNNGNYALLQLVGGPLQECRGVPAADPWQAAALAGVSVRAIGQEPGWDLEIVRGRWLRLNLDYGSRRILAPVPKPERFAAGVLYRTETEGHALEVRTIFHTCSDSMSGERFPLAVEVNIDGRMLRGCGRCLD